MKHIILASASPRRKEILELADLKFDVMPSDAQEITTKTAPNEVVMELASIKAKDIYKKSEKQSMIVGADTVVAYQGQILGKPTDEADAKRMLTMLSGQTHEVYTGVCVIEDGKTKTFYEGTKVTFYEISDEQIDRYIKTGEPMDKAGSYGIQGKAAVFIKGIEGDLDPLQIGLLRVREDVQNGIIFERFSKPGIADAVGCGFAQERTVRGQN